MENRKSQEKTDSRTNTHKINETLLEMIIGIVLFAFIGQVSFIWFTADKSGYSMGLWFGALMAVLAAFHMWHTLDRALEEEESAARAIQKSSILRYAVIVSILGLVMITKVFNPLAVFLGLMGLKVSAYIQPFTHRLRSSIGKE